MTWWEVSCGDYTTTVKDFTYLHAASFAMQIFYNALHKDKKFSELIMVSKMPNKIIMDTHFIETEMILQRLGISCF